MMKFNRETKLEHLPLHKLGFYECADGDIFTIFEEDDIYYIASFNANGYCTNASGYHSRRQAWMLFAQMLVDDLGGKIVESSDHENVRS